jgi:hypothetical protein
MSATVTLVGIELQASNLGLPESSDWYAWNYERDLIATAVNPVSVSVSVTGLSLTSALGTVRAQVVNDKVVGSSGRPASYNVTIQNAKLTIQGIGTTISTSGINAVGTINISRVVSISTARLVAQPQAISAVGILDISDEELITLLMAA